MKPLRTQNLLALFRKPDPSRDWLLALAFAGIVFLAFLAYAAFLFISIQSGAIFSGVRVPAPQIPVTRGDIQSILSTYQARQVDYAAHNLPAPPLADPSK
jgi:hypothetical protein